MRTTIVTVLGLLALLVLASGCMTHYHVVGEGAKGSSVEQTRQWYALWGLIPINSVDTKTMAKGAKDYEIKTEQAPLDIVINIVTSFVTVYSRTIEVKR
ncbi:MAG: hypothetical protein NTU47_15610 [Ignavibacteriales bacterium]|nr:hypothetical protein [Ignavibacteriales bacterium]